MSEFRGKYGRWAVIAGASEGVGAAIADQAAGRGLDLILIARNEPLLNSVAADIGARHGVEARPLALDLTDPGLGARVAAATEGLEVGLVVYNAGAANRTRPFLEDSFADSLRQVQLACALERMGVAFDPRRDLLPADAAREIIENIGNGPTHFVGDANRAAAARVWPGDRRAAVVAMSAATQAFARHRVSGGLFAL